jgi:hypothetical protein
MSFREYRNVQQNETGLFRRYFYSDSEPHCEYMVWMEAPLDMRKVGKVVSFELLVGETNWRLDAHASEPGFYIYRAPTRSLGIVAIKRRLRVVAPDRITEVRGALAELEKFLSQIDAGELIPPSPPDNPASLFQEYAISQTKAGYHRRYFRAEAEEEYVYTAWLKLPLDEQKRGPLVAFEFKGPWGTWLQREGEAGPVIEVEYFFLGDVVHRRATALILAELQVGLEELGRSLGQLGATELLPPVSPTKEQICTLWYMASRGQVRAPPSVGP